MRATPIKRLINKAGLAQAHLARTIRLSPGTFSDLVNHGKWPKGRTDLSDELSAALINAGAPAQAVTKALAASVATKQNAQRSSAERSTAKQGLATSKTSTTSIEKASDMLLQKQTLTQATRRHFGLSADPFTNDITQPSDVFISPDIRYVRETLWLHAKHGGLLALVGESGSGKTTTVGDFKDRLQREGRDVVIIEPSVLYMEQNDAKGKTLKAAGIVTAILASIAPGEPVRRDAESRARQVKQMLTAGHRSGQRHVLIIEEAHCLPKATLKHLKRFAELKDGLAPLLSIVLVGQPELRTSLAVNDAEVREVAQRCDIIELPALDNHLAEYIKFKFARIEVDVTKIIEPDAIDALRERLTFKKNSLSLVHPLAVANALTAALNAAAKLGAPTVDAAIIKEA